MTATKSLDGLIDIQIKGTGHSPCQGDDKYAFRQMGMVAGLKGPELGGSDAQPLGQRFQVDAPLAPCRRKGAAKLLQFRDWFCGGQYPCACGGRLLRIRNAAQGSHSITMTWMLASV